MNQQQAAEFVNAFNDLAKYVPPIIWDRAVHSPIIGMVVAVANGQAEISVKSNPTVVPQEPNKASQ